MRDTRELCLPPGPERDYRFKRLEQLRNDERIENLKIWWTGEREARKRVGTGA
jgi:hypothetical protein